MVLTREDLSFLENKHDPSYARICININTD